MSEKPSFFSELKRRNVYKVAVAFAVVGWLVIQIASIVLPTFHAPEWTLQAIIALVVIGFPAALISSQYAVAAPSLGKAIAVARAHLGQTDAALKEVRHLLTAVGEESLTPGLLRLYPLWDPLRNDPRFQELAAAK